MININPKIVIYVGIFLAIIAPYIFTQFSTGVHFGTPNEIGGTIGGITSPIIGIMGAILVYLTFEQQRFSINTEIEKSKNKKNSIRDVILTDLKQRQYDALIFCKNEIVDFNKHRDNLSITNYYFNEATNLNSDFFKSIPLQDLYEAFENKSEFYNIVYIYKKIEYIQKYALINLFQEAMFDYTETILYTTVLSKHRNILDYIPNHIDAVCGKIQGLSYTPTTHQ